MSADPRPAAATAGLRRVTPPMFAATAVIAIIASLFGAYLVPGMRGNASQHAVELFERTSATFSLAACGLLVLSVAASAAIFTRRDQPSWPLRTALQTASLCVCAASIHSIFGRLDEVLGIALSLSAEGAVLLGAAIALRSPSTRAVAIVLVAFGFASAARLVSWELASSSAEKADKVLYMGARVAATVSVVFELLGQLIALAWLARTRWPLQSGPTFDIGGITTPAPSRLTGVSVHGAWFAAIAVVVAVLVLLAANHGAAGGPLVDVVIHASIDRATTPPAFLFGNAAFLAPFALAAASVMFITVPRTGAVGVALVLALVGRGAYDVPLPALAATSSACFLALTALGIGAIRAREAYAKANAAHANASGNVLAADAPRNAPNIERAETDR